MKITNYKIIQAETANELAENVNKQLKLGYQPFGNVFTEEVVVKESGVIVKVTTSAVLFCQPVVIYE